MALSQDEKASPSISMPARIVLLTSSSGTPCSLSNDRIASEAKPSISPIWTEKWVKEGVDEI